VFKHAIAMPDTPVAEHGRNESDAGQAATQSGLLAQVVSRSEYPSGIVVGILADAGDAAGICVDVQGYGRVAVSHALVPVGAGDRGRAVAVSVASGAPNANVLLGFVWTPGEPAHASTPTVQADGQRVVIEAEHEMELRCGESAIVLTADGRIYLRGNYVTSHASATQRILGGSVHVN